MLSDRYLIRSDELSTREKLKIANVHAKTGHEGGPRRLTTTWAMTELERAYCTLDFELNSAAETASSNHAQPSAAPSNRSAISCRPLTSSGKAINTVVSRLQIWSGLRPASFIAWLAGANSVVEENALKMNRAG